MADYPLSVVAGELDALVCKGQWQALAIDLVRQTIGEDATYEQIQAFLVQRLDLLHDTGLIPRTVPMRIPRFVTAEEN